MKLIYKDNTLINDLEIGEKFIIFSVNNERIQKEINVKELMLNENYTLGYLNEEIENSILLQIAIDLHCYLYVKILKKEVIYFLERPTYSFKKNDGIQVHNNNKEVGILQTGSASFSLIKKEENKSFSVITELNELLSNKNLNEWQDIEIASMEKPGMQIISKINIQEKVVYVTYYPKRKKINVSKINLNTKNLDEKIKVTSINRNILKVINVNTNKECSFDFRKALNSELEIKGSKGFLKSNEIVNFTINKKKIFLYMKHNLLHASAEIKKAFAIKTNLKSLFLFNNLLIFGKYTNIRKSLSGKYDYIYIKGHANYIGKLKRPFVKKGKSFVFVNLKISDLINSSEMHRGLYLGDKNQAYYPLFMKEKMEKFEVFCKKNKKSTILLRANVGNGTSISILPFTKEYSKISSIKMKIAKHMNNIIPKKKRYNLYFEKKSSKADESAIHVFNEVIERKFTSSKNYFILDKKSSDFKMLKKKYKSKLIKKNSYRHYFMIYRADYFIASELSNHVLNDRVFINDIRKKITETPLIFLQHGIMFAKPIDNPMARGFNKNNLGCNVLKTVISSKKEAKEFYKVNYEPQDLLLTGLSTFDYASLYENADKIAYMPTYRYWEEHLVYTEKLKETSYYKSIMGVIKAFEKNGMLKDLMIVPHNKFSEYILNEFPEYKNNICTNPSKALKYAKVFITDYSSAIYDAIYRGAYPIFYWEEKETLIRNYKAIPPVNEDNAPGPIVYNLCDLVKTVDKAINNNYILEEEFKEKYKEINQFDDNKNTTRIINYMIETNIV